MYGRRFDVSELLEKIFIDDVYLGIKIVIGFLKGLFNSLYLDFFIIDLKLMCYSKWLKFKFNR